jgi:hypothetical protein
MLNIKSVTERRENMLWCACKRPLACMLCICLGLSGITQPTCSCFPWASAAASMVLA